MGWLRKEENIRFIRDEEGRVIRTERSGDVARTPASDALLKQQPKQPRKPSRIWETAKKVDRAIVKHNRRQPQRRSMGSGFGMVGSPMGDMFGYNEPSTKGKKPGGGKGKYIIRDGVAYPIAKSGKKKSKKKKGSRKRGGDPFSGWGL